jgi:hypothetical protein
VFQIFVIFFLDFSYEMPQHTHQSMQVLQSSQSSQQLEPPMKRCRSDDNSSSTSSSSLSALLYPNQAQTSFFSVHHEPCSLSEWINVVDPTLLHQATLQMNEEERGIVFSEYHSHTENFYNNYSGSGHPEVLLSGFSGNPSLAATSCLETGEDLIEQDVLEDSDNEES